MDPKRFQWIAMDWNGFHWIEWLPTDFELVVNGFKELQRVSVAAFGFPVDPNGFQWM